MLYALFFTASQLLLVVKDMRGFLIEKLDCTEALEHRFAG